MHSQAFLMEVQIPSLKGKIFICSTCVFTGAIVVPRKQINTGIQLTALISM